MQLPDEYQNDPQGRDKWHRNQKPLVKHTEYERKTKKYSEKNKRKLFQDYEEESKQLIEKIFSVNSYFYQ